MNKKILILANNSGGLYRFRKELISDMINKEYEVIVSTPFDDNIENLNELGISLVETKINRRGMNPVKDIRLLLDYFKLIRKTKPQLVISYTIKPNLYGCSIARLLKIPYTINITGLGTAFQKDNFLKKMVIFWYKFACKKAKIIFLENVGNKNIFVENNIIEKNKYCVLNGAGVNLDYFYFEKYPENDDIVHFLFIGRIMKEKGIDELLFAAKKIKKEYPDVEFDIVGPMEDDYKNKIEEYVNSNTINYYEYQSDVKKFIKQCHCFILPSYHEGMANTLLEAGSMGRPLITSNIHGCKEAIDNNGYLVKVRDKEDLYEKIKMFIELDHEKKVNMALNSRKHIEKVFDKRKVVKETMKGLGL